MFDLALSFDNGPEPDVTPHVLDVLKRRGVRATFFVIGEKLAMPGRRALAERARAEGHRIGNHTWSHSGPLGRRNDPGLSEREIGRTQKEMGDLADPCRFFRPQGGGAKLGPHLLSAETADYLERGKYTCVIWNAVPRDWVDPEGWAERGLAQCRERDWSLMVLHDLPSGAMLHLDAFLGRVADAGGRLRQDFPPDCVPMIEGVAGAAFGRYVSAKE